MYTGTPREDEGRDGVMLYKEYRPPPTPEAGAEA